MFLPITKIIFSSNDVFRRVQSSGAREWKTGPGGCGGFGGPDPCQHGATATTGCQVRVWGGKDVISRRFYFSNGKKYISSDRGSGRRPSKNKEAHERRGCYIATTE